MWTRGVGWWADWVQLEKTRELPTVELNAWNLTRGENSSIHVNWCAGFLNDSSTEKAVIDLSIIKKNLFKFSNLPLCKRSTSVTVKKGTNSAKENFHKLVNGHVNTLFYLHFCFLPTFCLKPRPVGHYILCEGLHVLQVIRLFSPHNF